jgi:hypothetical protein
MRKNIFWFAGVVCMSLVANSYALGQTLAQTAAYMLSGGFVDLGDIKEIDQDTVRIPEHMVTMTFLMRPLIYKVINPKQCEVSATPDGYEAEMKEIYFYLNNIIADEIDVKRFGSLSKVYFKGESNVACILSKGGKNCIRQYDTAAKTDTLERQGNAVRYLYSKFCTSARRKSAF